MNMVLRGKGVSKGTAIGKVKVVTCLSDVNKVTGESIVVTDNNSPLFSLAFMKAAGIVSEKGGLLCHLAIVSRELEKPCVLDVKDATKILKNDMMITINGDSGEIYF